MMEWVPILIAFGLGLGLPIGIPMILLNLLNRHPRYQLFFKRNPWIENYMDHLIMFLSAFLVIVWLSKGRLEEYGLSLGKVNLGWIGLSLFFAISLVAIIHFPQIVKRAPPRLSYPLTTTNIFGVLSCEWFFAG